MVGYQCYRLMFYFVHFLVYIIWISHTAALNYQHTSSGIHIENDRAVKLPWIFLGAPLISNGAPWIIQGNLTALELINPFLTASIQIYIKNVYCKFTSYIHDNHCNTEALAGVFILNLIKMNCITLTSLGTTGWKRCKMGLRQSFMWTMA